MTGIRIIDAILNGERDPLVLARMRDPRCKNSTETIARSFFGNYRPEHLFSLKQAVDLYTFYQRQINECDYQILAQLSIFDAGNSASDPKSELPVTIGEASQQMTGVGLTRTDGIDSNSALKIIAEIGTDMSHWKQRWQLDTLFGCPQA